jgi:hypothetical protein
MRALRRPRAVLASAVLAAAISLAACASAPASTDFRVSRSRASDVSLRHIQGEALTRDPGRSLMDVMASYWPSSMRGDPFARQFGGEQGIGAYVNGNYMGGWDFLRTVRAGEVVRVQRLTQSEEYLQFGRSHPNGGVVLIFRNSIAR